MSQKPIPAIPAGSPKHKIAIALHGGAGNILKRNLDSLQLQACRDKMKEALLAGYDLLRKDSSSLAAVEAVIRKLEDSPLFNAGKGSVFTHDGRNEMDAAIMDGHTLRAGAVAGTRTIKNPISAAKAVMERSDFVFLSGAGAEEFSMANGLEIVDPSYFYEEERWQQLLRVRDSTISTPKPDTTGYLQEESGQPEKFGTVGCVALDHFGNLAAGTSTGGIVNKQYNRIGDSPLIGSGTYANNSTCAVSCTGHGEDFIRAVAAYDISAMMEYKGYPLSKATYTLIMEKLKSTKGKGGVIALDRKGNISMVFNTEGMFRAYIDRKGNPVVHIFTKD